MTGIFGYCSTNIDQKKILNAIDTLEYNIREVTANTNCLLGSLSINTTTVKEESIKEGDKGLYVVTCGEIYNDDISDLKKEIIAFYKSKNLDQLKNINGSFTAAIYDNDNKKITIVNDRYGSIKTFYYFDNNCFCFAPKIRPLLAWGAKKTLRMDSLLDFFIFRYILGDKTFFENIFELPQASILEFSCNSIKLTRYWSYEQNNQYFLKSKEELIEELGQLWQKSVERRIKNYEPIIVPISGGLDSRAILAQIIKSIKKENITTYTYGEKGSYDFGIGQIIANKTGLKNIALGTNKENFKQQYDSSMDDTEGMIDATPYFSIDLDKYLKNYGTTIYSGLMGGEIMGPLIFPQIQNKELTSEKEYDKVKKIIFNHYKFNDPKIIQPLIHQKYLKNINIMNSFENSIKELKNISKERLPEYCAAWMYDQESNKYTKYCNLRYRNCFNYKLPFLDNELIDFMLRVPPKFKLHKNLYKSMLIKNYPELFNLPTKNSYGLKLTGNEFIKFIKRFLLFSQRKFNTITTYLNGKNYFLDKNKNYLDYDNLLRTDKEYQEYMKTMICKVKKREYFNKIYIEKLWDSHLNGRKNYATILGLLVTFELFLENYIDN